MPVFMMMFGFGSSLAILTNGPLLFKGLLEAFKRGYLLLGGLISLSSLEHFEVGSYRYRSLIEGLYTL